MKKIYLSIFLILLCSSLSFCDDCDKMRNEINNRKILRIGEFGLFIITSSALALSTVYYTGSTPRYESEEYKKSKKIAYGVTIACCIAIPFEIIPLIRNFKKINRLNDKMEQNCNGNQIKK
jgi:hypothetical protein